MPMPPCEPVIQVIELGRNVASSPGHSVGGSDLGTRLGCNGENLEKHSMESTVLNIYYVISSSGPLGP